VQPLPIDALVPEIVERLGEGPSLVLEAPPGAGKTTRVPPALLGDVGEVLVLEPRRLAARLAAVRVAEERGEKAGETVGYRVRFDEKVSARTRVTFVTEGILTRRLLGDPSLAGVSAVVLDEFHERHLQADVALALLQRLQKGPRPDLRVVVMSATLEAAPVAAFLGCPIVRSEGRRFDVAIEHAQTPDDRKLDLQVASAVRRLVAENLDGDVLVFLPGAAEIRHAEAACAKIAEAHDLFVVPLHGDLPPEKQDLAVRRADRRKVILATNVAESSVTIDGVVAVVDSGLVRAASHAPWSGLPVLAVGRASRASCTQRAGRAGRTRPGRCLRLFTKGDFDTRPEHDAPEILRLDLAQTVLELAASGHDIATLGWLDPPPDASVRAARELLVRLGALDGTRADTGAYPATELGRRMLAFPLHPRQARLLVEAEARGVGEDGAVLAALVAERDLRVATKTRFDGGRGGAGLDQPTQASDLVALLDLFREAEASRFSDSALRAIGLDRGVTFAVDRAQKQLARLLRRGGRRASGGQGPRSRDAIQAEEQDLAACVLAGYPDRVARRRRPGSRDLALAAGGTAELAESSVVRDAQFMVAVDAECRPGSGKVLVRLASGIDPLLLLELFASRIEEGTDVVWNAGAERVEVVTKMTYDGLTIDESRPPATAELDPPLEARVAEVLYREAAARGGVFAADGGVERLLSRARFAAGIDARVPAPTDEFIAAARAEACRGKRSLEELRGTSLVHAVRAHLGEAAWARIDALAPERVQLASGRVATIEYEAGKPPYLESYLQDFFGTKTQPRAGGVAIVLHLLAPNKRAVQVTTDLEGFWLRHYPAIKKELARKYPRHAWPDDPTIAIPMRPPRPRRS
jgi:ATP-dependent helicase HrpB